MDIICGRASAITDTRPANTPPSTPATAIEQRRLLLSLDVSGLVYSRPHICGSRGTILVDHHGEISVMRTTEHPTSARLPFLVLAGARGITLPNRNTVFMQW